MESLKTRFSEQLQLGQAQSLGPSKKILVAYSGGLDSHVLLHLVSHFIQQPLVEPLQLTVRAIHIHHGLQKEADTWVLHCKNICDELKIPLEVKHLNLTIKNGESIEERARMARYSALKDSLQSNEVLLTAHHQNDQAETLLLQLFRGAGVQGLAAMPTHSLFGLGGHARPLLAEPLSVLKSYAKEYCLDFIEDPSNQDSAFDRNFLRNEIMPKLRQRWSSIDKTISRSAAIQAETKQLLDEVAEQDLSLIGTQEDNTLSLAKLSKLSFERQKLLIRYWINSNGFNTPSEKKLAHIFSDVINADDDAQPLLEWQDTQLRRYKNKLYIMSPLAEHDTTQVIKWDTQEPLTIPVLQINLPALPELNPDKTHEVTVRFRQGGETVLQADGSHKSLKNILHAADIPPWLRSRVALIYLDNELIKVHFSF